MYDKMAETEKTSVAQQQQTGDTESPKLSEMLDRGWRLFEEIDTTDAPLGSISVQVKVKRGIRMLEEASMMVAQLVLFSHNEELEEIATADIKYLLLPALLGALCLKQTSREKRLDIVQTARAYFMDFLRRCKDYNVSQFELPKSINDSSTTDETSENGTSMAKPSIPCSSDLVSMAAQRQVKIERYRKKKELEARLLDARRAVECGQADEEVSRDFHLLNVQKWLAVCLEEINSIDQEIEILKRMDNLNHTAPEQPSRPARTPFKPFILTKDALQAQVFGAGYPSLPTMTVDDWYEQHKQRGVLPDQGLPKRVAVPEDYDPKEYEEEEKEKKIENDDEVSLRKAREWDDWKDDHRKGYGNRQNMG